MEPGRKKHRGAVATAVAMGLFGLLTVAVGGAVLFDLGGARGEAGNIVPAVLWLNFLAGFLYLLGALGLLRRKRWTPRVLLAAAVLVLAAAAGLALHAAGGGAYERRTVGALTFRFFLSLLLYAAARYYVRAVGPGHEPSHTPWNP